MFLVYALTVRDVLLECALFLFFLKVRLVMLAGASHSSRLPHVLTASFSLGLDWVSVLYRCLPHGPAAQEGQAAPYSPGVQWALPSGCA